MLLRPYQQAAVNSIFEYFAEHDGHPLLVLPTASGKSVIQAAFVRSVLQRFPDERLVLVSHVRELLEQNADKIRKWWPEAPVGIYSAGLKSRQLDRPVTVAGIQSIYQRAHELGPVSIMLIDECHLLPKKGEGMYRTFIKELRELNPKLKVIGMSATPYRLGTGLLHEGEGSIFTDVAYEAIIPELMDDGYLCPLISKLGRKRADLTHIHIRGGEFKQDELEQTMTTPELIAGAVDEIEKLAVERKKLLIFCAGVRHATLVCEEFLSRDIPTASVTGETPSEERRDILARFARGELRAIANVNVLTTGFDAPDIDCIVMLRPTMSPGLNYQMIGRGLRIHPSKDDALVLDFAGNILRHGPIDKIRIRSKAEGGGVETAPMRECPECHEAVFISLRVCPVCGYEFERDERPKHRTQASEAPVVSIPVESVEVDYVSYSVHSKAGKPPSLKVTYHAGMMQYYEWICIEHGGYAARKAFAWWKARSNLPAPKTTEEAIGVADLLKTPREITLSFVGKYPRVILCKELGEPVEVPF